MVDEFVPWIPRVLRDTFALGAFRAPEPKDPTPEPFVNVSADELTISDWDNQLPREPSESGPLSFGDGVLFAIKLRGVPLFLCASGPDAHGTAVHLSDRPDESSSHWQVVEAAKSGLVVFARPGDRHVINAWRGSSDGAALRLYSNRQHPNSQFEVVPVGTDGRRCKIRVSDAILHVAASPSRGAPVRLQSRPLARHCEWELVPLNMGHRRPTDEHRPRGANGARAGSPGVRLADSGAEPRHKAGEHDRGAGHASPIPRRGGQLLPQAGRDVEMYGPEGYRHPVYQPSTGRQAPAPMAQPAARPVAQRCAAGAARREHGEAPAALAAPQPWRVPQPQPFRLPGLVEQGVKHWYDHGTRQWQSKPFPFVLDPAPFSEGAMRVAYRLESRSGEGPRCHVAKASKADCDPAVYYTDIEMQVECQAVADAFNALGPPKLVSFVPCFLLQRFRGAHHLRLLAVEPYLSGEYTKYNNNYGFVSFDDRNTPQAFSHYSHHQSQGRMLIVDIQGVGDCYTDPQIHTINGKGFGKGNCGRKGIRKFFTSHQCNSICAYLGLPRINTGPLKDSGTHVPEDAVAPQATAATLHAGHAVHAGALGARVQPGAEPPPPIRSLLKPDPDAASNDELLTLGLTMDQFNSLAAEFRKFTRPGGIVVRRKDLVPLLRALGLFDAASPKLRDLESLTHRDAVTFAGFLCWWCGLECG